MGILTFGIIVGALDMVFTVIMYTNRIIMGMDMVPFIITHHFIILSIIIIIMVMAITIEEILLIPNEIVTIPAQAEETQLFIAEEPMRMLDVQILQHQDA